MPRGRDPARDRAGLTGVILELGRVASDRRPKCSRRALARVPVDGRRAASRASWRTGVARLTPSQEGSEIRIDARIPDTALGRQVATEVRSRRAVGAVGRVSVSLDEGRVMGVRELPKRALIKGAALVPSGSYTQARAEVRERGGRRYRRAMAVMISADALREALGADAALAGAGGEVNPCGVHVARRSATRLARPTRSETEAVIVLYAAWVYQSGGATRDPSSRPTKRDRPSTCPARFC